MHGYRASDLNTFMLLAGAVLSLPPAVQKEHLIVVLTSFGVGLLVPPLLSQAIHAASAVNRLEAVLDCVVMASTLSSLCFPRFEDENVKLRGSL
jgi:hypothetical protein